MAQQRAAGGGGSPRSAAGTPAEPRGRATTRRGDGGMHNRIGGDGGIHNRMGGGSVGGREASESPAGRRAWSVARMGSLSAAGQAEVRVRGAV